MNRFWMVHTVGTAERSLQEDNFPQRAMTNPYQAELICQRGSSDNDQFRDTEAPSNLAFLSGRE